MIVASAQCLNGVAVIHFAVCLVPLLRHPGRLCQPSKALVSNTKRHCCCSIVTCSASYHIESDGVTLFWSTVQLHSPGGIMGVNLPRAVLLQARKSIIISQSRWRGFSYVFLSLLSDYTAGIWFDSMLQDNRQQQPSPDNEWWNPHEIRWKLQNTQREREAVWFIIYVCSVGGWWCVGIHSIFLFRWKQWIEHPDLTDIISKPSDKSYI